VLSNHDVTRPVTRYGRADSSFAFASKRFGIHSDLELGTRRARAAALLTAALPGSLYVYQGDELGLPEVEDLPDGAREDPMHFRSNGVDPGRDGCRVPLPWSGTHPPFGFSPPDLQWRAPAPGQAGHRAVADPWLPQPPDWSRYTVEAQTHDPHSMLSLYRAALAIRRSVAALGDGTLEWLPSEPGVLAFSRGSGFVSVTNLADHAIDLPAEHVVLLASTEPEDAGRGILRLPPDSTAWLRTP
jgi:alpha-glucosidase